MVWENDKPCTQLDKEQQRRRRQQQENCIIKTLHVIQFHWGFLPTVVLVYAYFSTFFFINIKKRYCIHYYYNHTVIFTLKWCFLHPLSYIYMHTSHFFFLHRNREKNNIRQNILLLSALIYSHSISVWMDFFFSLSFFFWSLQIYFPWKIQKKKNEKQISASDWRHSCELYNGNDDGVEEINPLNFWHAFLFIWDCIKEISNVFSTLNKAM